MLMDLVLVIQKINMKFLTSSILYLLCPDAIILLNISG